MNFQGGVIYLFVIVIGVFFYSCKENTNKNDVVDVDFQDSVTKSLQNHAGNVKKIFYNVPSPIEMASIMQRAGASYDKNILNKTAAYDRYTTGSKQAINLGVYGADLSYTRMFDQIQESVNYLSVIRKLSEELGIPQQPGTFAVSRIEQNIENRDSLLYIITDIYSSADIYLKESNRGSTAALIILGGWVEALYIATNVVDIKKPNIEIMERIAEQKYSLQNLMDLIKQFENDEIIALYIPMLEKLQATFNKIDIVTTKAEIITDSVKKVTSISNNNKVNITLDDLVELKANVNEFRKELIK
jgi:hypothetical protein